MIRGSENTTNSHLCSTFVSKFYVEEFYSKQILLKQLDRLDSESHLFFFFLMLENKLYFEHRNNLKTSETNFLLKL